MYFKSCVKISHLRNRQQLALWSLGGAEEQHVSRRVREHQHICEVALTPQMLMAGHRRLIRISIGCLPVAGGSLVGGHHLHVCKLSLDRAFSQWLGPPSLPAFWITSVSMATLSTVIIDAQSSDIASDGPE